LPFSVLVHSFFKNLKYPIDLDFLEDAIGLFRRKSMLTINSIVYLSTKKESACGLAPVYVSDKNRSIFSVIMPIKYNLGDYIQ
jgi:hypothetical protein